jgi:hypothetical protein
LAGVRLSQFGRRAAGRPPRVGAVNPAEAGAHGAGCRSSSSPLTLFRVEAACADEATSRRVRAGSAVGGRAVRIGSDVVNHGVEGRRRASSSTQPVPALLETSSHRTTRASGPQAGRPSPPAGGTLAAVSAAIERAAIAHLRAAQDNAVKARADGRIRHDYGSSTMACAVTLTPGRASGRGPAHSGWGGRFALPQLFGQREHPPKSVPPQTRPSSRHVPRSASIPPAFRREEQQSAAAGRSILRPTTRPPYLTEFCAAALPAGPALPATRVSRYSPR